MLKMRTLTGKTIKHIVEMGTATKVWVGAIQLIFYLSAHNLSSIVCKLRGEWHY